MCSTSQEGLTAPSAPSQPPPSVPLPTPLASPSPAPAPLPSPALLLHQFLALQQQRAQLYARWHMGHRRYCESRQEGGLFRALLAATTASFQEVSQAVRGVEAELRADQEEGGAGRPDLAGLLRRVQDSEREKLRLTLSLQSLRTAAAFRTFSWQHGHAEGGAGLGGGHGGPLEPGHAPGPSAAGLQPDSLLLSKGHGHGCCGCGAREGAGGQEEEEPSEAEYTAAVQEALLLLDRCIADVNDALEEVRYALEELQE
ncbi:DNA repair REX1-B-domain-containing protein [Haematococcus lacustris]